MYFVGFSYLISWVIAEPRKPIREIKSYDFLCPYAKERNKAGKACKIQIVFGTWAEIKTIEMTKLKFGKPLCRSIMAVTVMMLSLQATAQNFSYTHQGQALNYNITSDSTVEVTQNSVSGEVVIPTQVEYHSTTYSVTSIGVGAFFGCSGLSLITMHYFHWR